MIIGLTGKAGVGKDTVADYLVHRHGFVKLSFASAIKSGLNAMFGWTQNQWEDREWKESTIGWIGKSPRQLAQTLGTEWGREQVHASIWVDIAIAKAETLSRDGYNVVLSDVRFNNEADALRSCGGIVWHIMRNDTEEVSAHTSEAGVSVDLEDAVIRNCCIKQHLYDSVEEKVTKYGK